MYDYYDFIIICYGWMKKNEYKLKWSQWKELTYRHSIEGISKNLSFGILFHSSSQNLLIFLQFFITIGFLPGFLFSFPGKMVWLLWCLGWKFSTLELKLLKLLLSSLHFLFFSYLVSLMENILTTLLFFSLIVDFDLGR